MPPDKTEAITTEYANIFTSPELALPWLVMPSGGHMKPRPRVACFARRSKVQTEGTGGLGGAPMNAFHRPSQREYVGAALLMLVSGVFAYVVLDGVGAALVCAGCVGVSLMVARNL
jgi:hypothetical protein